MTRTIKALAFSALLCATASFATSDNLLSMATNGAISKSTADTLSLNDKEMKDVVGGYIAQYTMTVDNIRYTVSYITAQMLDLSWKIGSSTQYARYSNGRLISSWRNNASGYLIWGSSATYR